MTQWLSSFLKLSHLNNKHWKPVYNKLYKQRWLECMKHIFWTCLLYQIISSTVLAQIDCGTPAAPKEIRAIITSPTQAGRTRTQEPDVLSYNVLFQQSCCAKEGGNLNSAKCLFFWKQFIFQRCCSVPFNMEHHLPTRHCTGSVHKIFPSEWVTRLN